MNRISSWLWFESQAEEAARFYASTFRRAKLGNIVRAPGGGEPRSSEGQVLVAEVYIDGHQICCLNGGPYPNAVPNDAISFQIICEDQAEVDEYWDKLTANGGKEKQCGWVSDRYGFSWQIVPEVLPRYTMGSDPEAARRVTAAMMQMVKLDVAKLQAAADGE